MTSTERKGSKECKLVATKRAEAQEAVLSALTGTQPLSSLRPPSLSETNTSLSLDVSMLTIPTAHALSDVFHGSQSQLNLKLWN